MLAGSRLWGPCKALGGAPQARQLPRGKSGCASESPSAGAPLRRGLSMLPKGGKRVREGLEHPTACPGPSRSVRPPKLSRAFVSSAGWPANLTDWSCGREEQSGETCVD